MIETASSTTSIYENVSTKFLSKTDKAVGGGFFFVHRQRDRLRKGKADSSIFPKTFELCGVYLRYYAPENRILNHVMSHVSIILREATLTFSDSI